LTQETLFACFVSVTIANNIPGKKTNRGKRIKGICSAAASLGVTRMHLWAVLKGHRQSKPLLTRYRAWKAKQKKPAKNLKP
jgi:hypothetical protein